MLSNLSAPVPCVLSNFRCKLVKSNSSLKIIITLKVFNILTSSHGGMDLASQECCLHRVLFTRRYVTFVLVIIMFVFTLYNVVVLEKYRTRSTIFKSILEQLRKIFDRTTRLAGGIYRRYLPSVFTGKYRHGQYSQKWRLPAFTGIYKYFINFSSNYIVDNPSYLLYYTWTP